jgi:hypothetical protein
MSNSLDESKRLDIGEQSAGRIDEPPDALLSFPILALLAPAAVFGVLARLGLVALMNFDGQSVFPVAYVQAVGCLVMGFGLRLKTPLTALYVASSWFCDYSKSIRYQLFPLVHGANNR